MKRKFILLSLVFCFSLFGQNHNPFIEELMNQTNLDSLISYVRILSGEDSVLIGYSTVLITHRSSRFGNDLAAEYIKQKLEDLGLETYDQRYSEEGRNIYSIQPGTVFPQKYFIYCAHYDSKDRFEPVKYCADDNASGVAGVLEAARILSKHQFQYSIIYALWDEEEIGLTGSKFFAAQADSNNMDIVSVLNFDMGGWDSDDDGLIDIHTRDIANSLDLAYFLFAIDSLYNLPLNSVIYRPGTWKSDQNSFWRVNYGAILLIEAYWGGDFNPYYHTDKDRIDKFNLPYFHNMSKLGVASIATLALESFVYYYPIHPIQTEIINKPYIRLFIDTLSVTTKFSNVGGYNFTSNIIFTSSDSSYIDSTALYDDGLHGDSLANDGLWGGFIHSISEEEFFSVGISSTHSEIGRYYYTGDLYIFTTAGPVKIDSLSITQTTSNYRVKPFIKNEGQSFTVKDLQINVSSNDSSIMQITVWGNLNIASIAPGEVVEPTGSFIVQVDTSFTGVFNFNFEIESGGKVYWKDSVSAIVTGIEDEITLPISYSLNQNYPNPFNPVTTIKYQIPELSFVTLKVYDVLGNEIATLVNDEKPAGSYEVEFDGTELTSGVYFYRLLAGSFVETKKMILMK